MKLNLIQKLILICIILLASLFRFYNLDWDQGHHLHPDERAIIMTVVRLQFPIDIHTFLSKDSPWNPHFFAYGSFPFYLLKITGEKLKVIDPLFASYDLINIAGRFISAIFDIITLILVFKISKKLYGLTTGYIGAFFYGISVLPIQLSHFYAVDTLLTSFSLAVLYLLILFYEQPKKIYALFIGICFGLALSTKISAIVLLVPILLTLIIDFVIHFLKKPHRPQHWLPHLPSFIKKLFISSIFIFAATLIVFAICSPYAIIDYNEFLRQTIEQSQMTKNAFVFPYTLQYVGIIPYWYELKNIYLWGLGPILASVCFAGIIYLFYSLFIHKKQFTLVSEIILATFFVVYFWVVGKFAIGFMRYMLPLYPLLCIFGGLAMHMIVRYLNTHIKYVFIRFTIFFLIYLTFLIWPISFIKIYTTQNTRTTATDWINNYIPAGKTLAQEHWDDAVPMTGSQKYNIVTLPLYDPDVPEKWQNINELLNRTDYIIIASNRLYTPLQKLTDCKSLPRDKCYPLTSAYYHNLFNGTLGFQKIVEFTSYPTIPLLNIPINDQAADESFTVYDHPKIMIFQKIQPSI